MSLALKYVALSGAMLLCSLLCYLCPL
jgi:hypothetical protein